MKKRKVNSHISNRVLYTLIALGILLIVGVGVYAYGTSNPAVFGHSINEIQFCNASQMLKMNAAGTTWTCANATGGTASSIPVYRVTNTYCVRPWQITTFTSTCPTATVPQSAKSVTTFAPGCSSSATWYYPCSAGQFATCAGQTYCSNTVAGYVLYG